MTATHEYRAARSDLLRYIDGLSHGNQRLLAYIAAVSHFEQCICAVYQAAQIHKKIEELLLPNDIIGENLFKSGDGSDLERINKIYNVIKHFSAQQATKQSAPVWITNYGLQSVDAIISFEELVDNIEALWEINRVTFIEIPNQKRQQGS